MIKAKDPMLALIDVAILGFLTKSPPFGTQDAQLPALLAAKLLYSQDQPIPSDNEPEEHAPEPTQKDLDKDFEVFYQEDPEDSLAPTHHHLTTAQVSTNQEVSNIPKEMVLEEKTPYLLALLTAHAEGDSPVVLIVPRPPTLALAHAAIADVTKKKRKRGKKTEGSEEEEIPYLTQQVPTK